MKALRTARRATRTASHAPRAMTATRRSLPHFIIIGAHRSGTTSLFQWLCSSPDVVSPSRKEVHYFDKCYHKSERWYRSHFPLTRRLDGARITGEATPYLLFDPLAPERVQAVVPNAKFIVLLRNPVDRAWSHYWHARSRGTEPLAFADAIEAESERIPQSDLYLRRYSYLSRGLYSEQLRRWFEHFPRERFLVLESEAMFSRPQDILDRACGWIGVTTGTATRVRFNAGNQPDMDAEMRQHLEQYFHDDQLRLSYLLEHDY